MQINEQIIAETVRSVLERTHADAPPQVMRTTASITLDFAERLMKRVEKEAVRMGIRVVTAVADAGGNPVAVRCMDGAYIGSYDAALNKAYTSVAFKMSTQTLGNLSQPGGPLYGIQLTNRARIVVFGGGVPLPIDGEPIGAIGVSGGSAEQDIHLADFAGEAFLEMTGQHGGKYE